MTARQEKYILHLSPILCGSFCPRGMLGIDAFYMMAESLCDEPDFSTFENKQGLAEDMKFLASMPELCDVTFLVGGKFSFSISWKIWK